MKSKIKKALLFFVVGILIVSAFPISSQLSINEAKNNKDKEMRATNSNCLPSYEEDCNLNNSIKILFIGSSLFMNNMPGLFENLAISAGKDVYIDELCLGGWSLYDHAQSILTERKINEQDWDYIILGGSGIRLAYPDYFTNDPVYPALVTLRNKISANCESTKMLLGMPWAFEDGMTWFEDWTDTYEDMQIKIFEKTLEYAYDIDFTIAPVGWAWYMVLEEKNYPLHYLHARDWSHPSVKGSYLMACVFYSTVFLESSIDIAYNGSLSEEEAKYFQGVASDTVLNNFNLWNIVDDLPPSIVIERPREYLYVADKELILLTSNTSVIFGKITTEVHAQDQQTGIEKIEFYIDNELKATVDETPFNWLIEDTLIGWHTIKAIAYDTAGNAASSEIEVWIFNI